MTKKRIVNIVATADLQQDVDLQELRKCKYVFHDSDVYGGMVAYYKSPNMQGKVSIFFTGKMISVGAKSEEKAKSELEQARKYLVEKKIITEPEALKPRVRNIVAVADLGKGIDLEVLANKHKMIYEPEQFPAGILKIDEPHKATILLYSNGKAVMSGIRSSKHIEPLIEYLENDILSKIQGKH